MIRCPTDADRPAWERLYSDYADFYRVEQTPAMRARVWDWIHDPLHEVQGLVAEGPDGTLIGLAHYRAFARPLAATTGGFLDDLFVTPAARGSGAARALIEAIKAEGHERGWNVIRWITAPDNARARGLYDQMAQAMPWVTYDLRL